ncbi:MAG: hypothetical protein ACTHKB_02915 [Burkholderiaceae bacterium]
MQVNEAAASSATVADPLHTGSTPTGSGPALRLLNTLDRTSFGPMLVIPKVGTTPVGDPYQTAATLMQSDANGDGVLDAGELQAAVSAYDGMDMLGQANAQYLVAAYRSKGTAGVDFNELAQMLTDGGIAVNDPLASLTPGQLVANIYAPGVAAAMGKALSSEGGSFLGIGSAEEFKAALQARGFTVNISDDDLHTLFTAYGGFFHSLMDVFIQAMLTEGALVLSPDGMTATATITDQTRYYEAGTINQLGTYASSEASPPMNAAQLRQGLDRAGYSTAGLTDAQLESLIAAYSGEDQGTISADQLAQAIKDGALVLSNNTAMLNEGAVTDGALANSLIAKGSDGNTIGNWQGLKTALVNSGYMLHMSDDDMHRLFAGYAGADGQLDAAEVVRMLTDGTNSLALSPDMQATASVTADTNTWIGNTLVQMAQAKGVPLNWQTIKSGLDALGYSTAGITDQQLQYLAAAYTGNTAGVPTAAQLGQMITDGSLELDIDAAVVNTANPALINALTASVTSHAATPGTITSGADLKQALAATGFADVRISDGLLQQLVNAYGTNGALSSAGLTTMINEGALTLGLDKTVTADPEAPTLLAELANVIAGTGAAPTGASRRLLAETSAAPTPPSTADALAAAAKQLNDGLAAAGFTRLSDKQAALLATAYGIPGSSQFSSAQLSAMIADGALVLAQETTATAAGWDTASLGHTARLSDALANLITDAAPNGLVDRAALKAGLLAYGITVVPTDAALDQLIAGYADAGKTTLSADQLSRMLDELGYDLGGTSGRGSTVRFDMNVPKVASLTVTANGVTVTGQTENGSYTMSLTGGVWKSDRATTYAAFKPVIKHPESLPQAVEYARQLASGKTLQQLFPGGSTKEQRDILQDAYELLGISNRQITAYAKAAKDGKIGYSSASQEARDAMAMLRVAGRMRAAVDTTGKGTLIRLNETFAYKNFPFGNPNNFIDTTGMINAIYAATGDKDLTSRFVLGSGLSGHVVWGTYNNVAIFPGNPVIGHTLDTSYDASLKDGRSQWKQVGVTSSGAAVDAMTPHADRFLLASESLDVPYALGNAGSPSLDPAKLYAFNVGGPYEMVSGDLKTGTAPSVADMNADGTAGATRALNVKVSPNAVFIDNQQVTDFGFGTVTNKDGTIFQAMVVHAGGKTYVFDAAKSKELITNIGTELFPSSELSDLYGLRSSVNPKQTVIQAAITKVITDYSNKDKKDLTPAQQAFLDHVRIAGLVNSGGPFAGYGSVSKDKMASIFDANANNQALQQDMLDPEVAKDITAATRQVLPTGTGQEALNTLKSDGFANFINFLGKNVSQAAADRAHASVLQVVATVAPDQVKDADATLLQKVYLQGLLATGSSADASAANQQFMDDLATLIAQDEANGGASIIRLIRQTDRGTGQLISTLNHFWVNAKGPGIDIKKTIFGTLTAIHAAWTEGRLSHNPTGGSSAIDAIIDADSSLNAAEKSAGKKFIAALNKGNDTGIFGTIAGVLALGSGIYKLSNPNVTASSTLEARLSIANDFLIFASVPSSYQNLAKSAVDLWGDFKIWRGGFTDQEKNVVMRAASQGIELSTAIQQTAGYTGRPAAALQQAESQVQAVTAQMAARSGTGVSGTNFLKTLWGIYQNPQFVGLIDTSTGIIGSVLAGYQIAHGIEKQDSFQQANGAINLLGGIAGTTAGIAEIIGFAAVSTALFAVGNFFNAVGTAMAIGKAYYDRDQTEARRVGDSEALVQRNKALLQPGGQAVYNELVANLWRTKPQPVPGLG